VPVRRKREETFLRWIAQQGWISVRGISCATDLVVYRSPLRPPSLMEKAAAVLSFPQVHDSIGLRKAR
jgi:hypothetical protein